MKRERFNIYDEVTKRMQEAGYSAEECEDASLRFQFTLKRCMQPKPQKEDLSR